jgi:hypothetical protein
MFVCQGYFSPLPAVEAATHETLGSLRRIGP